MSDHVKYLWMLAAYVAVIVFGAIVAQAIS